MTQTPPRTFTAVDAMIAAAMICGAAAAFAAATAVLPDRVAVYRQNTIIAEYPLKDDVSFTVNGKIGPVGIEIKNGAASITHATCPKGICAAAGAANSPNIQLICAPNNIMVKIVSTSGNGGVDGVTY
jgi:hypothetical protein